ncbi:hypothetical protein AB0M02_37725 [Actinoplanes sp. NPDC051861]|uniref:hypothetical protein n=1 Tax=Actinoplanes sp. NPDC051861 TaxID=3155170 RepID=UPI0034177E84
MEDKRDRRLLASLCAALPLLRERAEEGLWSDELDEMVGDLAAGEPVVEVCRRLGLVGEVDDQRNAENAPALPGVEGAHLAGIGEVVLDGAYRCPRNRCSRRAQRDDRGRVPVCALAEAPMTYRSGQ